MSQKIGRRAVLTGGLSALGSAVLAEAPFTSLRPLARPGAVPVLGDGGPSRPEERLVARPTLEDLIRAADLGGVTGVVIEDLETGEVLEARDAQVDLMPASVTKAVTALYAIDALGLNYRFETRVLATGPVENGVIDGDLILMGGGDPLLDTDALSGLVNALVDSGVRGLRGGFLVWAGAAPELREIDPGQLAHLGYNPGVSGLNLNFNRVHFEWARTGGNYTVSMDARSETLRPQVRVARMRVVDRAAPVYAYADEGGIDAWSVARGALGQAGSRWLPVRRPALYTGDVFRALAGARGLALPDPQMATARPEGEVLARHQSPPLSEIVRGMLRYSTNLTAEIIGRAATVAKGADASTLSGSAAVMSAWVAARYGVRTSFVDHSGLGDGSRLSAAAMVRILAQAEDGPLRDVLKHIPLVDDDREALPDPPGRVVAKTGTLNFVSTLAGYLDTDGRRLAFAILSADGDRRERGKASGDEQPTGSITFNTQAKRMQQRMLRRWGRMFGVVPLPSEVVRE